MSRRLLKTWLNNLPYTHTTIDDLESFMWLTCWCILCIIESKGQLQANESIVLRTFRSPHITDHYIARVDPITDMVDEDSPSRLLIQFGALLSKWNVISRKAAREIKDLLSSSLPPDNDCLYKLTIKYSGEYLKDGFDCLASLPKSWETCFGGMYILHRCNYTLTDSLPCRCCREEWLGCNVMAIQALP
jgi:hypothetical protein